MRRLRIEIDEVRAARRVAEITETDYFQDLQRKVSELRLDSDSELRAEPFDVVRLTFSCRKSPATRRSKCPEPDARLLTPYVELAHVDKAARRAQKGLASRIRNEH